MSQTDIFFGPLEGSEYLGGNIKKDSNVFTLMTIIVLFIAVIWIMYCIYKQIKFSGEDYNQRLTKLYFNSISGEEFDDAARNVIKYGESIDEPRAIDHYRIGAVYLVNAKNHAKAHEHFNKALEQIINGYVDPREAPFITNRIEDFGDEFINVDFEHDLPIQHAIQATLEQQRVQFTNAAKHKPEIKSDDPEFIQKTLLSRQDWQSDSQNVHDSAMYIQLQDQYQKLSEENARIKNNSLHDYDEAVNWLRVRYKDDPEKLAKINNVLNTISRDYPIGHLPNTRERNLITCIWQRSHDPDNRENSMKIREALGESLLDCTEGSTVVCMSGRTSKVWQALATIDKDPEIGILKTKQTFRNEIFQKAAKVVDDFIGENGSASQFLKDAYNADDQIEQVKELKETMAAKIDNIKHEYKDILPADQLETIIAECKTVVE